MTRRRTKGRTLRAGLLVLGVLALGLPARAQVSPSLYDFVRPGLEWYTIETEHFLVHFHADSSGEGTGRSAAVAARIAEEIYGPITSLYGHEPDTRVSIILKDYEDYSNGAAYFFDNKIEIWAPALDTPLRGTSGWLRNVITHEFTHIVQVQASMKGSRRRPLYYLQYLDYEETGRPDVLYGYPDAIVTYPVPVLNNPAWLAEGTAQYQRAGLGYDRWDSHRDMLLRTQVLADEQFSLAELGSFGSKTALGREQVYNHGYAFTHYLARTYGEESLAEVTRQLGRWSNTTVEAAISDAVGTDAEDVYAAWMDSLRTEYTARTAALRANPVEGRVVEPDGFTNLYPAFSPDGRRLAYVTNRGEENNVLSLVVRDDSTGATSAFRLDGLDEAHAGHACAFGQRLVSGANGRFAWTADGTGVVFAKLADTNTGRRYSDLYRFDLESEETTRLTRERRATEPAASPDGQALVFVAQRDGSTNLSLLDLTAEDPNATVRPLTRYADGTQVSDPVFSPDGAYVYFARSRERTRGIYRIPTAGGESAVVIDDPEADERSPTFGPDGALYFSSDAAGIYNLYRLDDAAKPERLTAVLGGAFTPAVAPDGRVAFARFQHDGYKIAVLDAPGGRVPPSDNLAAYTAPRVTDKVTVPGGSDLDFTALNAADDSDLGPLAGDAIQAIRTERHFEIRGADADPTAAPIGVARPYRNVFTSFQLYPVLRVDRYAAPRRSAVDAEAGRLGRELANTKVGFYASSREVLEGVSFLAGVLVAPASRPADDVADFFAPGRLVGLDRDLFLQLEYKRGLPFVPRRWSPQLALELYNVRRGVEDGLAIEESPCTACLPDTVYADLAYSLAEIGLYARSKINRNLLLELGYRQSPYTVRTSAFFSREFGQSIPASSDTYFRGRAVSLRAYYERQARRGTADVVPEGLRFTAAAEYAPGELLERYDVEDGRLVPVYERSNVNRLSLDARLGFRLPGRPLGGAHGLAFRAKASTILGDEVDDFYDDYVGGLTGARGYPFYALGGNETVWLQASYHFPIIPRLGRQLGPLFAEKLYGRLYADAAAAWTSGSDTNGAVAFRPDVGAELRLRLDSFYLFPTAVFASATYGLGEFDLRLPNGFLTPEGSPTVGYGGEMQFHFGALFEFEL